MVYLVDDDVDDLEFVQEALVTNSYKGPVDTASNGQQLMERLITTTAKPDVIILDLNMPLLDGFQALHQIKSNPDLSRIPVIILTASASKEDEVRCLALGCQSYFQKPNRLDLYRDLVTTVKGIIRQRRGNAL
ncbi:MAG TPA: response regulator [Chryseosolibacter sp.]